MTLLAAYPSTLSPYEIFFGEKIEGRGLDYFVDYEPAFAAVKHDLKPIQERLVNEFLPFVVCDDSVIHLELDGVESWGDPASAIEDVVEDALWRGTYGGYLIVRHLTEGLPNG